MTIICVLDSKHPEPAKVAQPRGSATPAKIFKEIEEKAEEGLKENLINKLDLSILRDAIKQAKKEIEVKESTDSLNNLMTRLENIQVPEINVVLMFEILEEELILILDDDLKRRLSAIAALIK